MDLNTSSFDEGAPESSKEQIILATREVKKAHSRNRKKRTKVFCHVVDYLDGIIPAAYEQHKNHLMGNLIESMDEMRDLFLEVFKLLLLLLEQGSQVEAIHYDASNYATILESFLLHLKQWCISQESNTGREPMLYFLDLTSQLLTGIIELVAESDSWRYVEFINTPVTFIILQWGDAGGQEASDKLLRWTQSTAYSMNSLEKRISQCVDFDCQYFLMIIIQQWLTWAGRQTAENYLEAAFPSVGLDFRRCLLEIQDFDYGGRTFLNALNSNIIRGPKARGGIFSIRCLYFFAGDEHLQPPEESDQLWIDFSASSRRLHAFISLPSNPWVNWNIGYEHIDSICVSWLRRGAVGGGNNKSQMMMSQNCTATTTQAFTQEDFTQMSNLSIGESSCLMFLHIQLKDNFSETNQDLSEFHDLDIRSLTLVFQDLSMVERILHQMSFPTHSNGEQCIRPQGLLDIIEGNNKESSLMPQQPEVSHVEEEQLSPIIVQLEQEEEEEVVPETLCPAVTPMPAENSLLANRLATPGRKFGRQVSVIPRGTPHPHHHLQALNQETPTSNKENNSHHDYVEVIETPGGFHIPLTSSEEESEQEEEQEYNAPGSKDMYSSDDDAGWSNRINKSKKKFNHSIRSLNATMESMMEDPIPRSVREKLSSRESSDSISPKSPIIVPVLNSPPLKDNEENEIPKETGRFIVNSDLSLFLSVEESRDRGQKGIKERKRKKKVATEPMIEVPKTPLSVREKLSSRESSDSVSPKSPIIVPVRNSSPNQNEKNDNPKEKERFLLNSQLSLFLSDEESADRGQNRIKERKKKKVAAEPRVKESRDRGQNRVRERKKKQPALRVVQNKLITTTVEKNPVPKVSGKSPCYRKKIINAPTPPRNLNVNENVNVELSPEFMDPYDITADEDFLKESLLKTYSRKRKRHYPGRTINKRPAPKPATLKKVPQQEEQEQQQSISKKTIFAATPSPPPQDLNFDDTFDWNNIDRSSSFKRRSASRPATPKNLPQQEEEQQIVALTPSPPRNFNLDDTFDWNNIDRSSSFKKRSASRPATPKNVPQQQQQPISKKIIVAPTPLPPPRNFNLDDTFDWNNIDLEL